MNDHFPRVAVTGATGFIGSALLKVLWESGWHINALTRKKKNRVLPQKKNLTWITGDLNDIDSIKKLVAGSDAVVHCAGTVRGRALKDFEAVNVHGTSTIAEICSRCQKPPILIHISSLAAREPHLSHYAASKRAGEIALIKKYYPEKLVILRPTAVYGPGDRELLPLFKVMAMGICPVIGSTTQRLSLIHVHDLANAIKTVIKTGVARDAGIYEIHDGMEGGYTWHDIIDTVSIITGKKINRIKIPATIVKFLGLVNICVSRITGNAPMLTPGKANELLHPDWTAENGPIFQDYHWSPVISLKKGLRELLAA